jgi:tubulin alpha
MVANSTCIQEVISRMNSKFAVMAKKRAFVHHYVGAGMEESELQDAQENLLALEKDYTELNIPTNVYEEQTREAEVY